MCCGQKAELWGLPSSAASLNKLSQQYLAHGWLFSVSVCCGLGTKSLRGSQGSRKWPKFRPREKQIGIWDAQEKQDCHLGSVPRVAALSFKHGDSQWCQTIQSYIYRQPHVLSSQTVSLICNDLSPQNSCWSLVPIVRYQSSGNLISPCLEVRF